MSLVLLVTLLGSLIAFLTYRYLIYPLLFSPLRKIPKAHWSSGICPLWIAYYRRGGSQAIPAISKAHAQKGPIVLLGPNELSVASFEGANKVYIERGGFAKPRWWAELFTSYGVINMTSMQGGIGNRAHAERKRDMGNIYAKSFLMKNEQMAQVCRKHLGQMHTALDKVVAEEKGVLDVYSFNAAVNADFISAFQFGIEAGTKFTEDAAAREAYFYNHSIWLKGKSGAAAGQRYLEQFGYSRVNATETQLEEGKGQSDAIVYQQLRARGLEGNELASEVLDHFIAGAEAPRTVCTYMQWELSKNPDIQDRLRKEVSTLWNAQNHGGNGVDLPDFKALDALPLLEGVLMETMRLYTPTPGPQHRLTPPGGTTIHDHFIPGALAISATLAVLHNNPSVFPDPEQWRPDRWMTNDQSKLEEMRKWFWAFSKGSRSCIGKDFTLLVMKLTTAAIYSRYTTSVVEDSGMEQEDLFLAGPVGEKLILKFQPVIDM
ncbi:cytochrome P450 [Lophiotrema nucula]|uniref:Cytochrome P450 n=1 Tax=Lophiotrema nucula TaxID=690887 RepID=A0A6A5YF17_9PLEO|nr:cytochrome P450 [Lophiotrema nucula]